MSELNPVHSTHTSRSRIQASDYVAVMRYVSADKTRLRMASCVINPRLFRNTYAWAVPWLRKLVAGLPPRSPGFAQGSVHVGFVVDKVALEHVFHQVFRFFPVSIIILPELRTHIGLSSSGRRTIVSLVETVRIHSLNSWKKKTITLSLLIHEESQLYFHFLFLPIILSAVFSGFRCLLLFVSA
jgi:hypothetical protein